MIGWMNGWMDDIKDDNNNDDDDDIYTIGPLQVG
jgi:hypothetical protein